MSGPKTERVPLPYLPEPAVRATLPNGHQIFAVRKPGDVVHLHTMVRTGSVNETEANTGVSHFLEHLMFKGTARFPAGTFDRLLEGVGARINAGTSRDFTQYHVTLPRGEDGEHYRLALDLHADMLLHAALPEEEIGLPFDPEHPPAEKRERSVVLEEIRMGLDNPWRRAIQRLTEVMYPGHPYRREVIGTAQVIATIPRADIEAYYRTWYQPANMVTIVAGNLPHDEIIESVTAAFAFPNARPAPMEAFAVEPAPTSPRIEHISLPLNVAYVVLGYLGAPSADERAIVALDAVSLLLGEGMSSRIHQRLVEQMPNTPFVDAGSSHWTYRDSSQVLAYGVVRPDAAEQSTDLLRAEVARLHAEPPTGDEFAKAITRLEAQFAAQAETSAGLSNALSDSMARLNAPEGYSNYLPILRSLTPDDLAAYAAQYLPEEGVCVVTVGPSDV